MFTIYNHNKLTRQPFFADLITYLLNHEDVTLRQLKKDFADVRNLERAIEDYVQADYIIRADKRYTVALAVYGDELLTGASDTPARLVYREPFLVASGSELQKRLDKSRIYTTVTTSANGLVLHESSDYARRETTLANYFYHVDQPSLPLSDAERAIYEVIGDVSEDYAMKYMSTFWLRFLNKDVVNMRRPDIFVQTLVALGYASGDEGAFSNEVAFEEEVALSEVVFDRADDFIQAQIAQQTVLPAYLSLD
jgi:hypothetical protein